MKKYPFLFCGFTGCVWKFSGRASFPAPGRCSMKGTTSLLMFPIYGCASLILPVYQKLKNLPALLRGSLYTAGFYLAEFTSGSILQAFHMCPWDYSECPISTKESSVWTISRLVSHWIVFRKNTYKIFLKNHSK